MSWLENRGCNPTSEESVMTDNPLTLRTTGVFDELMRQLDKVK